MNHLATVSKPKKEKGYCLVNRQGNIINQPNHPQTTIPAATATTAAITLPLLVRLTLTVPLVFTLAVGVAPAPVVLPAPLVVVEPTDVPVPVPVPTLSLSLSEVLAGPEAVNSPVAVAAVASPVIFPGP